MGTLIAILGAGLLLWWLFAAINRHDELVASGQASTTRILSAGAIGLSVLVGMFFMLT